MIKGLRNRIGAGRARAAAALLGALAVAGCGDFVGVAPTDRDRILAALVLNHHAVLLSTSAPWDTVRLSATPMNPDGVPLSATAATRYSVSDSLAVRITGDGLLTALAPRGQVLVIATQTVGNVTRKDTAYVAVTDAAAPPALARFSIQPPPGDSAKVAATDPLHLAGTKMLTLQAVDAQEAPIDGVVAHFTSSDRSLATVDPATGIVSAIRPGTVMIRATTTAYGVSMRDSLVLTITAPLLGFIPVRQISPVSSPTPVLVFTLDTLRLSAGGMVMFANESTTLDIDVVFDDPSKVAEAPFFPSGAGNIPRFHAGEGGVGSFVARAFFVPGTYNYHSTLFDTHGTIIVE